MTRREAFEMFLMDRKLSGRSPRTLLYYRHTLTPFISDLDVATLPEAIQPHYAALLERGLSAVSMHTHHRGIKAFCRFCEAEGFLADPIRLPRVMKPKTNVRPISVDAMREVLSVLNQKTFLGLRDHTIVLSLFDTGIRLGELVGIDLGDVQFDQRGIYVRGKGDKERWVPYGRAVHQALWKYVKARQIQGPKSGALFITRGGHRLHPHSVQSIFRRLKRRANVQGRFYPHLLRHSGSVAFVESGGAESALQDKLGHETREMTRVYLTLGREVLRQQQERHSPGDQI